MNRDTKQDIYISRFHEEAFGGILSCLKKVNPLSLNESHIVIVPDRYTLCAENLICKHLERQGSFNISLLTFKRLAANITPLKYLSANGAVMLVKKAVSDVLDKLVCYSKAAMFTGFAKSIYAEICKFKSHNITPEELYIAAEKEKGEIAVRLSDIALIYQRYLSLAEGKYTDNEGCCKLIAESSEKSTLIKNSRFYIAGFDFFSKAEEYCLQKLVSTGIKCTFATAEGECAETIKNIISSAGRDFDLQYIKDNRSKTADFLYKNINSYKSIAYSGKADFKLSVCASAAQETEKTAQEIVFAVKKGGLRFNEICVVLPDISAYIYPIDKIFKLYGIPYYISESGTLTGEPLFKALHLLFCAVENNCGFNDVLSFVKSAYFDYSEKDIFIFENYLRLYGIDRSRFLQNFTLGDENSGREIAENVRTKFESYYNMISSGILPCCDFIKSAKSVLLRLCKNDCSEKQANLLLDEGYADEAAYRKQVYDKIIKLLDEAEEICGGEKISLKQFIELLTAGAESVRLSIIPLSADAVNCGGIDLPRYLFSKKIFILGANEGNFPQTSFNTSLIPYGEMTGSKLCYTDSVMLLKRERERIRHLFCMQSDYYISCRDIDENGKEIKPSEYFLKLKSILGLDIETGLKYSLQREKYSFTEKSRKLDTADKLFFSGGKASVSALEAYFDCPRKFLYRYGFFALPRKENRLRSLDKGIFLHAAAELFMKEFTPEADEKALAEKCYETVLKNEEFKRFLSDVLQAAQFERLKEEIIRVCAALAEQIRLSDFKPVYIEAEFDGGKDFPLIKLDTEYKSLYLKGKIDRADIYENDGEKYIRVIDYKSGNVKYDEKSLYFGKKVQLFIYMYGLKLCGFKPAGVYYFPICDKYAEEDEYIYRLTGVTVNEQAVINASDRTISGGGSTVLKLALKQGSDGYKNNVNLLHREAFEKRISYAVKLCSLAAGEILGGNISVCPVENSCGYCDYNEVCTFDLNTASVRKQTAQRAGTLIEEALDE